MTADGGGVPLPRLASPDYALNGNHLWRRTPPIPNTRLRGKVAFQTPLNRARPTFRMGDQLDAGSRDGASSSPTATPCPRRRAARTRAWRSGRPPGDPQRHPRLWRICSNNRKAANITRDDLGLGRRRALVVVLHRQSPVRSARQGPPATAERAHGRGRGARTISTLAGRPHEIRRRRLRFPRCCGAEERPAAVGRKSETARKTATKKAAPAGQAWSIVAIGAPEGTELFIVWGDSRGRSPRWRATGQDPRALLSLASARSSTCWARPPPK